MTSDWTWHGFFQLVLGILQWTLAILSVAATVALFSWILLLISKKDKAK
jgi:hypothetical protein